MQDTLAPVTQERIEAELDGFGLKHFRSEKTGQIRTALPGLVCFFQLEGAGFKISTRWMATARTDEDIRRLRLAANQYNRALPLIRVHPMAREDGSRVAIMEAPFFVSEGLTDTQLHKMLEFYFSLVTHIGGELEKEIPGIRDNTTEGTV